MKRILVAFTLLVTVNCMAQHPPAAVREAFAKSFPGITVTKWDKEGGKYEANFTKNGKSMSATFNVSGVLEETETDIKVTELPSSITSYIKTKYSGANIKEAAVIINAGGVKMYEAAIKGKDLLFDMQGKFVKEEEE